MVDQSLTEREPETPLTSPVSEPEPEEVTIPVTPDAPASAPVADMGAVMGDVVMPAVNPGALREAEKTPAVSEGTMVVKPGVPRKGVTDDKGRAFDPGIHESKDGKPLINAKGWLKCKRGGAAQKGAAHASKLEPGAAPSAITTPGPSSASVQLEAQIAATATTASTILFTVGQLIGGEEFAPRVDAKTGENEPAFIEGAFTNYFRAKGVVDIPPGAALSIALVAYVGKRWNAPKFSERRNGWWQTVKSYLARRRQRIVDERTADERKRAAGF